MTSASRRIYNRTASAHINVSSPTSPSSPPPPPPPQPQPQPVPQPRKPASPPPPTIIAPVPVGAKKKKKKRTKGKGGQGGPNDRPLGDEELDYSHRDYEDRDLTDDDIPDLVDIDKPSHNQAPPTLSIPMTATSSTSSKTPTTTSGGSKSKKKKKKTKAGVVLPAENDLDHHGAPGDYGTQKIWNTTTAEEKERIKEFWLGLSEQERRNLVRVEKEHVSKRVKEGSKILNCSCHVCGRKQVAIEEELDVLYDAYYEELENYSSPHAIQFGPEPPPDLIYEDEEDDEEYDDDDDYDDSQDGDEHYHHHHHGLSDEYVESRREIFNFGANLMAKGGVLTIADDLLQNQGKQFIDMMEKIADMRFKKEEEAKKEVAEAGGPYDDDYDDDQDDYYEEEDAEDSEEDEDPKIAERRRMEEGRRMFHIFAARMFEQRVLAAYREKVARERQQKLLEEIEEEDRKAEEKNSKKAKEKEKKKEKQRLLKQQKEEDRLRKEAEKAAEEAARRQEEENRADEQRKKKEDARLKREAERKQQETDRLKKEEERRKRQADERERQQEIERKRREKDEAAKKRREEALKKEKDAKDLREREIREKKEREEREKREKETRVKSSTTARRQSTPASPPRTILSQPAIPKISTPGRSSVPPPTTTPPHQLANGSSSTPGTMTHSPSPRVSGILPPQLHSQHVGQQSSHFHVPIQPPPGTGFSSPTMRNQFPPILENMGPHQHMMASPMQPGRPSNVGVPPMVNGLPLGIYAPLPIGNPNQYGRFPPNQQAGYSPGNLPALPHSLARGYDAAPPGTPTYPSPIGSMPPHGSPILPPPSKTVESGMSSPQVSHSRKTSIDAMTDLPGSLGPRHLPPGINGSGAPPGLSRTIVRPAPIQRPQSTTSSGRGSGFLQDEEMGVGSRALLDDGVEDLAEDEIIEPSSGSAPGFGQTRRTNAFTSLGDKLWTAPPSSSSSDTMWGQQDKNSFLWGNNMTPSSATEEHAFSNWDARPLPFTAFQLSTLQERIKDILVRTDPQAYYPLDSIVAHLQRQFPMDRVTAEDVIQAAQAAPTSFLVMPKDRKWVIRSINPTDTRALAGARMMTVLGPKPGTPPNDMGRNMLGSLAEVVRGFD